MGVPLFASGFPALCGSVDADRLSVGLRILFFGLLAFHFPHFVAVCFCPFAVPSEASLRDLPDVALA